MNDIIIIPEKSWLRLLEVGNKIWLVKEHKEATVLAPFKEPAFYCAFGRALGSIRLLIDEQESIWHVSYNGKGFDKSLLMLPIYGNIQTVEEYNDKEDLIWCNNYNITLEQLRDFEKKIDGKWKNTRVAAKLLIEMEFEDYRYISSVLADYEECDNVEVDKVPTSEIVTIPKFELMQPVFTVKRRIHT